MYFLKTAPEYLKKEIKFFYSVKMKNVTGGFTVHRRLPDGTLDIVLNLKKPIYFSKGGNSFEQMPLLALTGLYTDKCFLKYSDQIHVVCAVLQPGYAHLFINDALEHHQSATNNASDIFGNKLHMLHERMHDIDDEKDKHRLFEKFLLSHLQIAKNSHSMHNIENALASIHESSGAVSVNSLCKKHFMSERNLRRKFIEYVGMSPKKYEAIIRMKSFCSMYQQGISYSDCIAHLAFTDRSHFHKEFIKITGTNPESFFKETNELGEKFLRFI